MLILLRHTVDAAEGRCLVADRYSSVAALSGMAFVCSGAPAPVANGTSPAHDLTTEHGRVVEANWVVRA